MKCLFCKKKEVLENKDHCDSPQCKELSKGKEKANSEILSTMFNVFFAPFVEKDTNHYPDGSIIDPEYEYYR